MTRPLAATDPISNIFAVVGTQRNSGAEFFMQGNIMPELTVFGGVTYIDARLLDTGVAATNDKLVVGVPKIKADIAVDYHPAFLRGFALTGASNPNWSCVFAAPTITCSRSGLTMPVDGNSSSTS
jgi:iron complex outermembrane receptor protein